MKIKLLWFFLSGCSIFVSCTNKIYLKKINSYLNAASVEDKSRYMAEDYHSWFLVKEGEGKNKSEALKSFQNWDGPMQPDIKILSYTFRGHTWVVSFNEQNDFTKPIGYPGWKGTTTFRFNSGGLIDETVYVPDSTNLPYKPFLKPALEWLRENMPAELNEIYRDNKLVQTEAAANKWKELLTKWQSQKKTGN